MSWWPCRRKPLLVIASPTHDLDVRASKAYNAKRWAEAERLYHEVLAKGNTEGRQVARNMLGKICERQNRVGEAIAFYEANVSERSPNGWPYTRLAIIYHKRQQRTEEGRILNIAIGALPGTQGWYRDRLDKLLSSDSHVLGAR